MTRKGKIVLLVVLGLVGWGYFNNTTHQTYMETPEYKDKKARSSSIDSGQVVKSETGRKFFEGYEWAQDRDVPEHARECSQRNCWARQG